MSDIREVHEMPPTPFNGPPDWVQEWGSGVRYHQHLLNHLHHWSRGWAISDRSDLLKIAREVLIPIKIQWEKAMLTETDEAIALCEKYNKPETGLFNVLYKQFNDCMADLESKYPTIATLLREQDKRTSIIVKVSSKVLSNDNKTTVTFRHGPPTSKGGFDHLLAVKGLEAVRDRLTKRSSLQEEQILTLALAFEEKGLQLPPKFAAIQKQLDELRLSTDMSAQPGDPELAAKPVALIEHIGGKSFTGIFENEAKRRVIPPQELSRTAIEMFWGSTGAGESSRLFREPLTKKQSAKYFKVVKQHRDFHTIMKRIEEEQDYDSRKFFGDIRLMVDNYCHFFGEGSREYKMALDFEQLLLRNLDEYMLEGGKTGITHYKEAPRAVFSDTNEVPDDTMCTIDTQAAVDYIEAFNEAQRAGDKEQEAGDKEQEAGDKEQEARCNGRKEDGKIREEDGQNEDADDESQETDDENENVIDPDEQETSFAQGINEEWDSDYGEAREHSLHIEDDYFDRQDGDDLAGSPVDPSPNPRDPSSPFSGEDNTIDKAWNVMDQALQYDRNVGNPTQAPVRHNTQQPGASASAQPPRPRPQDDETGEQPAGDHSFYDQYDYPDPDATAFGGPHEAAIDELGADDTFGSFQLSSDSLDASPEAAAGDASPDNTLGSIPNPYSDDLVSVPSDAASEADEEGTHASAHAFHQAAPIAAVGAEQSASHQPAPIAPMVAEPSAIQPASLPQSQPADTGSASPKRARELDGQDSSDDDAPLIKRRKTAGKAPSSVAAQGEAPASAVTKGKAPASASASSSCKRRRDDSDADSDDDADSDYVPEPPSKRQRKTPSQDNTPAAAAKGKAAATPSQPNTSTAAPKDKGKAPAAPVAISTRKRSRDEDDEEEDGDNYAPENPSPALAQAPIAAEPAAAEASGDYSLDDYQRLSGRVRQARELQRQQIEAQRLQQLLQEDLFPGLPPSPAWESFTPERAATPEQADTDGHRSMSPERAEPAVAGPSRQAAADEPQGEPATTSLGLTDQGTITVMQLQRMAKYRNTTHSKGAIANRPLVFGYGTGDQYALYVMRCPTKGCPKAGYGTGPDEFRKNPFCDLLPLNHLAECCGDYGGDDDDLMVRKYCKQVISDDKKAVSIEWARKWNISLIDEYGNYPDADGGNNDMRNHNFPPPAAAE